MEDKNFLYEPYTPFSESQIWQINRDYYNHAGIRAWSDNEVPHHMTSNSLVGRTYAALIIGLLKDLATQGKTEETVYLLELGAGHGRLAFHILMHLEKECALLDMHLPKYCYVLSDIVEENIQFFENHPDFVRFKKEGVLDFSYFDAVASTTLELRHSHTSIGPQSLKAPIVAIANYFFDSIPNDLFLLQNGVVKECSIALYTTAKEELSATQLLEELELRYRKEKAEAPCYEKEIYNEMLFDYSKKLKHTHLFFPKMGLECIQNIRQLSNVGLLLLSMDKGFYDLHDLEGREEPEIITHGSFSLWVNYHALGAFCEKQNGSVWFPKYSTFHLQMGCLLFVDESEKYTALDEAYQHHINDFGPDDFNSIKQLAYQNISRLTLKELIAVLRLSAYDSTLFKKMFSRIRQVSQQVTFNERRRLSETMDAVWQMYFNIHESFDMAYEIGGLFYDLGFYKKAIFYFEKCILAERVGADIYYNMALCHYHLQEDEAFLKTLEKGKKAFPDFARFTELEALDLDVK